MNVSKYTLTKDCIILKNLFLSGDVIYIESYDPVNGRPQKVFSDTKAFLGEVSSDFYWEIEKCIIKSKE